MVTNIKKLQRLKNIERIGDGKPCPKCFKVMERRKHKDIPSKTWFYQKWDYCLDCKHVQHYEEFKSNAWKEGLEMESRFNNSLFE